MKINKWFSRLVLERNVYEPVPAFNQTESSIYETMIAIKMRSKCVLKERTNMWFRNVRIIKAGKGIIVINPYVVDTV